LDPERASIYEKYDAIKRAKEEAESPPAEEVAEEAPPEKAGATEEKPEAAQEEEAVPLDQAKEKVKGLKVKVKLDGKEEVLDADALLERLTKEEGRERSLQRKAQELAREREAFEHQRAVATQPSPAPSETPIPAEDGEVEQRYNELALESPYRANQYLEAVKADRQRKQAAADKARMDAAESQFFTVHPDLEGPVKEFFADGKNFSDPRVEDAMRRGDFYGVLEIAHNRIEAQRLAADRAAIKAAQDAAIAEEKKRIDLKKKGSVIRTTTKTEVKPPEEFKPPTPSEVIASEAARRRALRNQ
jgi:hypothetical protein